MLWRRKKSERATIPYSFLCFFGPVRDATLKSSFSGNASHSCSHWFETQFFMQGNLLMPTPEQWDSGEGMCLPWCSAAFTSQEKGVAGGQGRAHPDCAAHHGSDEDAGTERKGDNLAWLGSKNRE